MTPDSSRTVRFAIADREACYGLVERVLTNRRYEALGREQRGTVRQFLVRVTGRSRAQITRLISQWVETRTIQAKTPARRRFATRYTAADARLLAEVDAAHEDLSGPAVKRILRREYEIYSRKEFERLAQISVSHLYNLRGSKAYQKVRVRVEPTRASQVNIGERRKPEPRGKPGYLRVDTVHQGHQDGQPGLYHINAVDTVTQWQVVGCVETICERHLLPVLEAMLHQFPVRRPQVSLRQRQRVQPYAIVPNITLALHVRQCRAGILRARVSRRDPQTGQEAIPSPAPVQAFPKCLTHRAIRFS